MTKNDFIKKLILKKNRYLYRSYIYVKSMEMILQPVTVTLLVESVWKSANFSVNALGVLLLGEILTDILVSRGSNFVHDLLAKLNESRTQA